MICFARLAPPVMALLLAGAQPAWAQTPEAPEPCAERSADGRAYLVCSARPRSDIRLFFANPDGEPFGTFTAVRDALAANGETLVFAMNAGMYNPDYSPAGLYVEQGRQIKPANQRAGAGNFHLKPNGVFWINRERDAGVTETGRYLASRIQPVFATQSGPLLVNEGKLHPRIHPDGTSRKIRNGVGACADGVTQFAISNEPVTFHEFALFFRDELKCRNALFLDGSISSIYAPGAKRHDRWRPMGPIVGLVKGK
ncbi:MAG: hypothetical protein JWN93_1032 [Hyphomicrobiales bacterium]|nr:hypothetical protein [Hyphomicrobiales bacterium]